MCWYSLVGLSALVVGGCATAPSSDSGLARLEVFNVSRAQQPNMKGYVLSIRNAAGTELFNMRDVSFWSMTHHQDIPAGTYTIRYACGDRNYKDTRDDPYWGNRSQDGSITVKAGDYVEILVDDNSRWAYQARHSPINPAQFFMQPVRIQECTIAFRKK